jgi:hypothetical protein
MSFIKAAFLVAFIAVCALSYMGPVIEGDFFWHLNAGRVIVEGGEIPFGTFPTQWLGQVLMYLVWKAGGYGGVVFLRAGVYSAILLGLFLWMRKEGVQFFICVFYLLFPARIFISFPSERPQLLTFLFFPLCVYLLEVFRKEEKARAVWPLPVLLVLWANVHGGVLAGIACVWVYFLAEGACLLRRKTSPGKFLAAGAVALAPAMVFFLIDPKAVVSMWKTALSLFTPDEYMASVQEYLSPYAAAKGLGLYFPSYWAFLAITLLTALAGLRRMPVHHLLLVLLFSALSLKSLRFMPFLLMLAPVVALYCPWRKDNWEWSKVLLGGFTAVLGIWLLVTPMKVQAGLSRDFPKDAAKFIKYMLYTSNIFNYQGWSGYLTWELKGRKVFIPTEGVTGRRNEAYENILWADTTSVMGNEQWKALLDAYGIDTVIVPGISPISGEAFPITDSLVWTKGWFLVYSDEVANIFVRDKPRNSTAISLYSRPKGNAYLQVVGQAKRRLKEEPENKTLWRTLGEAYRKLGLNEEAEEVFKKSGLLSPSP